MNNNKNTLQNTINELFLNKTVIIEFVCKGKFLSGRIDNFVISNVKIIKKYNYTILKLNNLLEIYYDELFIDKSIVSLFNKGEENINILLPTKGV